MNPTLTSPKNRRPFLGTTLASRASTASRVAAGAPPTVPTVASAVVAPRNLSNSANNKTATVAVLHNEPWSLTAIKLIGAAIDDALTSFEISRQKCLIVGQMLSEVKNKLNHGEFENYVKRNFPQLAERTAYRWVAAAENILKQLPPPDEVATIEISTLLLTTDNSQLSKPAQAYKQILLDLNNNTTLKDAANGVFNEGDEAHRITRAVNGQTKGGAGGDRKDFPLFIARKLDDIGTHLSHWSAMTTTQRTECMTAIRNAMLGHKTTLNGRHDVFNSKLWPDDFVRALVEAGKEHLKTRANAKE